jgi:hypothetical protein
VNWLSCTRELAQRSPPQIGRQGRVVQQLLANLQRQLRPALEAVGLGHGEPDATLRVDVGRRLGQAQGRVDVLPGFLVPVDIQQLGAQPLQQQRVCRQRGLVEA